MHSSGFKKISIQSILKNLFLNEEKGNKKAGLPLKHRLFHHYQYTNSYFSIRMRASTATILSPSPSKGFISISLISGA